MLGQSASHFAAGAAGTGSGEAASILSFAAAVSGFSLGWSSLASDYTVNFPEETSTIRVFLYTYIGVNIPLCSMEMFGAAMSEFDFHYARLKASLPNTTGLVGRSARLNKFLIFFALLFSDHFRI